MQKAIEKIINGYRRFHEKQVLKDPSVFEKLADGQTPEVAFIACSDSRVDPSIITQSKLGELFVIRNVANLVPPYQPDDATYHGTSAALEFAVNILGVKHLIVFGHGQCAGIRTLVEGKQKKGGEPSFIHSWMSIAEEARRDVMNEHKHLSMDEKAHLCERRGIEKSLQNLITFPWVKQKVEEGTLALHGWHFELDNGVICALADKEWKPL